MYRSARLTPAPASFLPGYGNSTDSEGTTARTAGWSRIENDATWKGAWGSWTRWLGRATVNIFATSTRLTPVFATQPKLILKRLNGFESLVEQFVVWRPFVFRELSCQFPKSLKYVIKYPHQNINGTRFSILTGFLKLSDKCVDRLTTRRLLTHFQLGKNTIADCLIIWSSFWNNLSIFFD